MDKKAGENCCKLPKGNPRKPVDNNKEKCYNKYTYVRLNGMAEGRPAPTERNECNTGLTDPFSASGRMQPGRMHSFPLYFIALLLLF